MTKYELKFSLVVEHMLSQIYEPAYRQIVVEVRTQCQIDETPNRLLQSFMVVATILERNQELCFQETINMDKVLPKRPKFIYVIYVDYSRSF